MSNGHLVFTHRFPRNTALVLCLFCFLAPCSVISPAQSQLRFTDVTSQSGIQFQHEDGRSGEKYFLETLGSGAAWLDYNNDGNLDLYFVNGADLPGMHSPVPPTNALYLR